MVKQARFVVRNIRDDRRLQREFGVIDTIENRVIMHTSSRYRAEEEAEDLNVEMQYSWN